MTSANAPRWVTIEEVLELHDFVLAESGGLVGMRDRSLLESALMRPANAFGYEGLDDIRELAAIYGVAVAKNHPFADGNKRAAFMALGLFLDLNGFSLQATDDDATAMMQGVAAGERDQSQLSAWLRAHTAPA